MADLSGMFGTIDAALGQGSNSAPPPPMPGSVPPAAPAAPGQDDTDPSFRLQLRFRDPSKPLPLPPGVTNDAPSPPSRAQGTIDAIDAALAAPATGQYAPPPPLSAPPAPMPPAAPPKPTWGDIPGDIANSAIGGVESGFVGLLSLPRTIRDAVARGENWAIAKAYGLTGQLPAGETEQSMRDALNKLDDTFAGDRMDRAMLPSSGDYNKILGKLGADIYQPKTVPGEYAHTIGEFLPGAGRNLITGAVIPAVASEAAGQATKGTDLEPYARLAGGVAGGIAGGVAPAALKPVKSYLEPLTGAGQDAIAARTLAGAAADLPATRAALDQPAEIVPGSHPTTFQQTGDPGLGQLERTQRTSKATVAPYIERDQAQNKARFDALQGVQQGGSPADVAAQFRQMRDLLDQDRQARVADRLPLLAYIEQTAKNLKDEEMTAATRDLRRRLEAGLTSLA